MLSCARQWKGYDDIVTQLAGRPAPLIFQWMELWVPGLDWGASAAPYRKAIHQLEEKGFRQMLLSEYIAWPKTIALAAHGIDGSIQLQTSFFQGKWG